MLIPQKPSTLRLHLSYLSATALMALFIFLTLLGGDAAPRASSEAKASFPQLLLSFTGQQICPSKPENPVVAVAAEAMNTLYIGVENPITIAASGIAVEDLSIRAKGIRLRRIGDAAHYISSPTTPGKASITIAGPGLSPQVFEFEVKQIPYATVRLGNRDPGRIKSGVMRAQKGLVAHLDGCHLDIHLDIYRFKIHYKAKGREVLTLAQEGNQLTGLAAQWVRQAKPGDEYYFTDIIMRDIACRSPGPGIGDLRYIVH